MRALDRRIITAVIGAALVTYGLLNVNSLSAQIQSYVAIIIGGLIIIKSRD